MSEPRCPLCGRERTHFLMTPTCERQFEDQQCSNCEEPCKNWPAVQALMDENEALRLAGDLQEQEIARLKAENVELCAAIRKRLESEAQAEPRPTPGAGDDGANLPDEMLEQLAKTSPPPQEWHDEDFGNLTGP